METVLLVIGVVVVLAILVALGRESSPEVPDNVTDEDIRQLAQQGKKIQAVKYYRALHGVDLKEAKEAVEEMM